MYLEESYYKENRNKQKDKTVNGKKVMRMNLKRKIRTYEASS